MIWQRGSPKTRYLTTGVSVGLAFVAGSSAYPRLATQNCQEDEFLQTLPGQPFVSSRAGRRRKSIQWQRTI
jgi:hypothetical protein